MPRRAPVKSCDLLVLGAGLAGLSAARAARASAPDLRVLLASPRQGPSGSSFANVNNALGVQAPAEREAEAFVDEVLRLAPPGQVRPELVRALAEDAPASVAELLELGLAFRRDGRGELIRFPGCFSSVPRACIFDGLAQAHAAFSAAARAAGVAFLHGFEAVELRTEGGRAAGARLAATRGDAVLDLRARAVVVALGGPGPLFLRRHCGPGSGLGLGLLALAGAELVNARYLQFFWLDARSKAFVNPGCLTWPAELACLARARQGHCPLAYGLPDAELDARLLALRSPDGIVRPTDIPAGGTPLLLAAHAGNGGALIDAQGRSSVPGLFACGECAGGMHGANRLGGAMVLSALVFGKRAGVAAAQEAMGLAEPLSARGFGAAWTPDRSGDAVFVARLRRGMERSIDGWGLPGGVPDERFLDWLRAAARRKGADSARQRALAASALAVLTGLARPLGGMVG